MLFSSPARFTCFPHGNLADGGELWSVDGEPLSEVAPYCAVPGCREETIRMIRRKRESQTRKNEAPNCSSSVGLRVLEACSDAEYPHTR